MTEDERRKLSESLLRDTELRFRGFQYSGHNLVEEVNSFNPRLVVDVGCGANYFRGKIKNLIGFDIDYYPDAHCQSSIQDMKIHPESVDVALALGTFQYFVRERSFSDLSTVASWVRPGGYLVIRLKKFVSEAESVASSYLWSQEWFEKASEDLGLKVVKGIWTDQNPLIPGLERIVWWWQKQ
jgi:trans-aconitate methyltransferase